MCNQTTYTRKCQHRRKGRKCKTKMEFVDVTPLVSGKLLIEDWYCRKCNITHRMFVFICPDTSGIMQ
jgi:hypothetical protein